MVVEEVQYSEPVLGVKNVLKSKPAKSHFIFIKNVVSLAAFIWLFILNQYYESYFTVVRFVSDTGSLKKWAWALLE